MQANKDENMNEETYSSFFRGKTIFLTGATGNLGSCILYKLVTQLQVGRVFVLVRGSKTETFEKWRCKMQSHARALEDSKKICFIKGDITMPSQGITPTDIEILRLNAEIIIHAAASISLMDPISKCMKNNCEPTLELARLSTTFAKLERFVYVSSAYINSHLPDGPVKEKLYPLYDSTGEDIDAELEREAILRAGSSTYTSRFAWPYALSKYLAERLLLERHSSLPLLIVRPGMHGPALRVPFPLFGAEAALPVSHGIKIYFRNPEASKRWHAAENASSGSNYMDETPIDWVSNVVLLHTAAHTRGAVHATAGNYVKATADELMNHLQPRPHDQLNMVESIDWIPMGSKPQCALARFLVVANRNWDFSCEKSRPLRVVCGPLSMQVTVEEAKAHADKRIVTIYEEVQRELSMWVQ